MNRLSILLSLLLILSLILAMLVISQQYKVSLSASIPRIYSIPKWSCDITCKCIAPTAWSELVFEPIGTTPGKETICSNSNPSTNQDTSSYDEYGYKSTSQCYDLCKAAYPNQNGVAGSSAQGSRRNCQQSGSCYVHIPTHTPTPLVSPDNNPFTIIPTRTPSPLITPGSNLITAPNPTPK
jgi:hypothetical protein